MVPGAYIWDCPWLARDAGERQAEGEIRARILQHIRQRLPAPEGTEQKIRELQQQTKEALEDYAYIRDTYLKEIADGRKREREAQQKALEAKEETICIQKERITELEGKIRSLKRGKNKRNLQVPKRNKGNYRFYRDFSDVEKVRISCGFGNISGRYGYSEEQRNSCCVVWKKGCPMMTWRGLHPGAYTGADGPFTPDL
ncbi:MAG: hypothetical protein ACLUOI_08060 [Eisenbergiella sp.]